MTDETELLAMSASPLCPFLHIMDWWDFGNFPENMEDTVEKQERLC